MDFKEVIKFMELDDSIMTFIKYEQIKVPFKITSSEYLNFAKYDIDSGKDKRFIVNALSNAKRSLDCQIDSLLIALNLFRHAKKIKLNIPQKINLLNQIGILAPRVLTKINYIRNLVEHEFAVPTKEEILDFIDIIDLFNECTNIYLNDFPESSEIEYENGEDGFLSIDFNRKENNVGIRCVKIDGNDEKTHIIDALHKDYPNFLTLYIKKFRRK